MDMGKALRLLQEQLAKIDTLKKPPAYNPEYEIWNNITVKIMREVFAPDLVEMFEDAGPHQMAMNDKYYYLFISKTLEERNNYLKVLSVSISVLPAPVTSV